MGKNKTYLGDSVYAEWDGYGVTVYLDNGDGPTNKVYMEPSVCNGLFNFLKNVSSQEEL